MARTATPRPVHFCACGDHAFAPLTKGFMAMVSPEDAHLLTQHWRAHVGKQAKPYVTILSSAGGKFVLARVITAAPKGMKADHISGQTMDNRRANLRVCTHAENMRNRSGKKGRDLPKGVSKLGNRFIAKVGIEGKSFFVGCFRTVEAAAEAYRVAALELHGEFARAA